MLVGTFLHIGDSGVDRPCHVSVTKLARTPNQGRSRVSVGDPRWPGWRSRLRFDLRSQEADGVGCAEIGAICIHDGNTATEYAVVASWVLRVGVVHSYSSHRPARPQNREWLTLDTCALVSVSQPGTPPPDRPYRHLCAGSELCRVPDRTVDSTAFYSLNPMRSRIT